MHDVRLPRNLDPDRPLVATEMGKRYGRTQALDGISIAVRRGSVTALVGPNGAGKSTLIKTWVGFERPSRGRVAVCGLDPWAQRAQSLAHVGYVPQSPALYRSLTVSDHLDLGAQYRRSFDRRLSERRLDDLGISQRTKASDLSGGQAAQVSLAIALGTRADVLLLDEPLASLDPLARREFLDILVEDVRTYGRTAVLSSHVVSDVARGCDRIVVLGVGRKMLDDSISNALATHRLLASAGSLPPTCSVASIRSEEGRPVYVIRDDGKAETSTQPATLDDIVMAYLTAGRSMLAGPRATQC